MASLYLLDDDGTAAQRWDLGDQPLAIGRDDSADIKVPDGALSRRHFLIERQGESYLVKDLNSQNGTWVDGQRASSIPLHHHDCIVAGRSIFMFSQQSPATGHPAAGARAVS